MPTHLSPDSQGCVSSLFFCLAHSFRCLPQHALPGTSGFLTLSRKFPSLPCGSSQISLLFILSSLVFSSSAIARFTACLPWAFSDHSNTQYLSFYLSHFLMFTKKIRLRTPRMDPKSPNIIWSLHCASPIFLATNTCNCLTGRESEPIAAHLRLTQNHLNRDGRLIHFCLRHTGNCMATSEVPHSIFSHATAIPVQVLRYLP